ncbi:hypothetical protein KEM48_004966 [Puccinia striiformis f. sp. tritici PST-130]|nr:hypothetical protein KEM48_004966 [Puccinia striiformis f. sp. tritici PST-130]
MYSHTPADKQTQESANRHTYTSEYSDDFKRESYMDPNPRTNQRRDDTHQETFTPFQPAYAPRNNHTDGGAMGISEPGSPILIADDQHSNESLSSGDRTKTDTRSPGSHQAIPSAGKTAMLMSDGYDAYSGTRNPQQPGYVPGDAFSPSSPAYGRYRQALNHDWRNSDLGSQDGTTFGDEKYAPTKDISDDLKVLLQSSLLDRIVWNGSTGFVALPLWSSSHIISVISPGPNLIPKFCLWGVSMDFFGNGQLAVGMYFLLGGRVLAHSFLRSAFTRPMVPKDSHGVPIPGGKAARWTGPRWLSLSSSLFRRSIRLAFPAIIVAIIQWRIASQNMLGDRPVQAAQILSPTALWLPTWNSIGSFGGLLQFCLDLFTNRGHQYMLSAGSALWTTYDQFWVPFSFTSWLLQSPKSDTLAATSSTLLFVDRSGFVRQTSDHWKPTMLVEISVMILALAMISGGTKVASPADI